MHLMASHGEIIRIPTQTRLKSSDFSSEITFMPKTGA